MALTLSLTSVQVLTALQAFLMTVTGLPMEQIIDAQDNRVPMPKGTFISMTSLLESELSVPSSTFTKTGTTEAVNSRLMWICQLDCYDDDSAQDLATAIKAVIRTPYCVDQFKLSGFDMAPLYATDPRNTNMLNGENQFNDRWTFEFHAQINPVIQTPMQSANKLEIGLVEVETTFPSGDA